MYSADSFAGTALGEGHYGTGTSPVPSKKSSSMAKVRYLGSCPVRRIFADSLRNFAPEVMLLWMDVDLPAIRRRRHGERRRAVGRARSHLFGRIHSRMRISTVARAQHGR